MEMTHNIVLGKCLVTELEIPNGFTWTDHDKEGSFNSCLACCPDYEHKSVAGALAALNKKREDDND